MTIVVGGYIVAFPLGGMTWHHLNYLLGLDELGHEVWFLEDSGDYSVPYNPTTRACDSDPTYGIGYLETTFGEYGLPPRYCYYSPFLDAYYGLSKAELHDLLRRADLLICVSGVTAIRPDRPRPRRTVVIDTDPALTQLRMRGDREFLDYYRQFDRAATFGRLIGTSACSIPTHGIDWIATCQPVCLRHWPLTPPISREFTTVGKWEHSADRHVEFEGKRYLSSKGVEWMKVIDLPHRVPDWTMTIGMQAVPGNVRSQFESHGWKWIDPELATVSCSTFAQFIRASAGEFTVAKEIYRSLPSGWFSDRSACYLASGRPVVTQASGFDRWLPVSEGLFPFHSVEEAAEVLHQIAANYDHHSRSARRIAEEYLDSRKVLAHLLDQVM